MEDDNRVVLQLNAEALNVLIKTLSPDLLLDLQKGVIEAVIHNIFAEMLPGGWEELIREEIAKSTNKYFVLPERFGDIQLSNEVRDKIETCAKWEFRRLLTTDIFKPLKEDQVKTIDEKAAFLQMSVETTLKNFQQDADLYLNSAINSGMANYIDDAVEKRITFLMKNKESPEAQNC